MDLNDPRRRLQALQNQNPSIRISAGPVAQPKINISQNNVPKNIGPVSTQGITGAKPKPVDTRAWGTKVFDTVNPLDDGRSWATPGTQAMPNFLQRNASPTGLFNIGKEIVQGTARYPIEFGATVLSPVKKIQAGEAARKAGIKDGTPEMAQAVKNAGSHSWQPSGWQKRLFGDAKIQNFAETGKDIKGAIKDGTGKDVNSGVVTAGIIGLGALPVIGNPIKKLAKGGLKLFGKGAKNADTVVKSVIESSDPIEIKSMLGNVDDDVAQYLATETNPETVRQVLAEMAVDPNIRLTDDVRQRLQDEGITAVREGESPYGTHYNTGGKSITISDPKYTDPQYVYQELGHHIYSTKLTPDEKAAFASIKGRAYQEAVGRAGYTADDLASEDFSDYMRLAMSNRLNEVPEEVRSVVQKYAKVAAQEAETAGVALPTPKSTDLKPSVKTKVDQSLVNDGLVSGKIFNAKLNDLKLGTDTVGDIDINQVSKYIDDISSGKPIEPVIVQRGPNGELLVDDGKHRLEALKALGIEDIPVIEKGAKSAVPTPEQAIGDVSKAQTGVSDAAPDGSVKTTSPEDTGTTFNYLDTQTSQRVLNNAVEPRADVWRRWFHDSDHTALPEIEKDILKNPQLKDAGVSRLYDYYKEMFGDNISFHDFMNKDITLYRGGNTTRPNSIASYTLLERKAKRFGDVSSITVKPKDTYGMLGDFSEGEVFVPKTRSGAPIEKTPNYMKDKVTPEGYFTEGRYKDSAYPKSFVAKTDIPDTNIKAGDKVALVKDRDGYFTAILDKPYEDGGFYVRREHNIDPNQFSTSGAPIEKTPLTPREEINQTQKADEIVPNADSETKRAVQEVLDNLNGAQKNFDDAAQAVAPAVNQNADEAAKSITRSNDDGKELAEFLTDSHKNLPSGTRVKVSYQPAGTQDIITVEGTVKSAYGGKLRNDTYDMTVSGNTQSYNNYSSEGRMIVTDKNGNNHLINNMDVNSVDIGAPTSSGSGMQFTKSADEMFPGASPEDRAEIQRVMDSLKEANTSYGKESKDFSKRRGAALYQGDANAQEVGGMAGYKEQLKALKNVKKDSNFEPVEVSEGFRDRVLTSIQKNEKLMPGEKLNRSTAVLKLFGEVEGTPTPREQKLIREVLGDDVADLVDEAIEQAKGGMTARDVAEQLAGAPRTMMTIGDASAPRQLAVSFARHPIITTKEYLKSFGDMFSGKRFAARNADMLNMTDPTGKSYSEFMESSMNLHFSNIAEEATEESMSSAPLLSRIPVLGKVVEGSNRGMSSATSWTRFNIAKKFIDDAGGVEEASRLFSKEDLADLGEVLNTITGRGGKKGGFTDKHASILSKTLFSGKLWAARMNMLNPYWYYRLSGPARKEALQSAASFAATAGVVLTLVDQLPGVEVGKEPTSADFGKIKVGNTRFDIMGGFQQNIRVFNQIVTNKRTNSVTGEQKDVTGASVLGGLIEGKANPLLGYAYNVLNTVPDEDSNNPFMRKDEWGNSINIAKEGAQLGVPLPISGVAETMADQGKGKGFLMSLPGFFGAGVQTYGGTPTKDQGKDGEYKGKITDDMVLDNNGKPMLDKNGAVIKAKFDKDMSDMERQAALTSKQKEAYRAKAKTLLSKDDLGIYKLGQADEGQLDDTQLKKYKQIKKWVSNYGKTIEVPKEVTSDVAKGFYQKYNSMTEDDQKAWLKEGPDENANKIAAALNQQRTSGLSEFKPSNELSKAYAEYEKDINSHPEYTEFDLRKKAREFQKFAYKLNYTTDQRDLYSANIGDVKYMINEKMLSKEDLDAAIKMDDEMYNAGLISSLKFSKRFRNEFGYGLPDGGGVNENLASGGGSGSGDSTPRTYIANLLPSFKQSGGGEKPTFSSKRRTAGISFKNVTTPKSSSGKKVSINL